MKLQTTVPIIKANSPIGYQNKMVLLGSCFAENMGRKLEFYKFQQLQNPFGILFHPLAIECVVARAIDGNTYQEDEVFEHRGIWCCFDAHSDCNADSRSGLLQRLNKKLDEMKKGLEEASHVMITLGTSWIYRSVATQKVVANCHKVPQKEFSKELLPKEVLRKSIRNLIDMVQKVNPKVQLIFTISPVRHLKDGFVENQRSKAGLISALQEVLSAQQAPEGLFYFPSYEIMMDELRDYRFYEKDMVHPNDLAIDYIWERFKSAWISPASHDIMERVEAVQKGLSHRPFNPNSAEHQQFKASLQCKITYLKKTYPFIKF